MKEIRNTKFSFVNVMQTAYPGDLSLIKW